MKTFSQIYDDLKKKFFDRSKLDIEPGTVVDFYMLSSSEALYEAHQEIEANKNPHIFTKLSDEDLDNTGYGFNCPRMANEADDSYRYRLMNWTQKSEASNLTAIQLALMNMTYASYVTYTPLTEGVGTATAYIIPKTYDDATIENAIAETESRLKDVCSPGSYINYVIPNALPVKVVAYISVDSGDIVTVKDNIKKKVTQYVNNIPVGGLLEIGEINKIGVNESCVSYFNTVQLYVDNNVTAALSVLQKIESKFVFDDIIWWTAVK
jgi:hypothetical protein